MSWVKSLEKNTVTLYERLKNVGKIKFSEGIFGLEDFSEAKLILNKEDFPVFILSQEKEGSVTEFFVSYLLGEVEGYSPDLRKEDVPLSFMTSDEDLILLNILTVWPRNSDHSKITANLIAPLIVNTKKRIGKQVFLFNSEEYSSEHLLVP